MTKSSDTMASNTERLDDLEVKFSYQQETIDQLNDMVTKQWDLIDRLRLQIERLEGRLAEVAASGGEAGDEPPPPHY